MGAKRGKAATAALEVLTAAGVPFTVHEYGHDPSADSYGMEAAEKIGVDPARVFKTLVVLSGETLFVGVVPVARQLDLKAMAQACGVKSVVMCPVDRAERITGYVAGGISPLGQKKCLTTVIDASAQEHDTVYLSAGRRGLDVELAPNDLVKSTNGSFIFIAR